MLEKIRQTGILAAYAAGNELLKRYGKYQRKDQKFKSFHEIVTQADLAAEKIILKEIKNNFPDHQILSEEAGQNKNKSDYLWVVDPLDGTHNFSMHNPLWSVSIACLYKNEVILGIIFAPFLNELYVAEKNVGAWLNGRRLHVSGFSGAKVINTYCHGGTIKDIKRAIKYYDYQKLHNLDIRQLGSAALELAYVAAGRIESIVIPGARSWDVAAGALLVSEAGGRISDFKNNNWNIKSSDLAASNGVIHSDLIKILKKTI